MLPLNDVEAELLDKLATSSLITGDEISRRLQEQVLLLPEKQRIIFNLKYYEDLTYEEISKILNTSVGSLKASYHHATKKLEKRLGEGFFAE